MLARVVDVLMASNNLFSLIFVVYVSKPLLEMEWLHQSTGDIAGVTKVTVKRDHGDHPVTFTAALASVAAQPRNTRIFR